MVWVTVRLSAASRPTTWKLEGDSVATALASYDLVGLPTMLKVTGALVIVPPPVAVVGRM